MKINFELIFLQWRKRTATFIVAVLALIFNGDHSMGQTIGERPVIEDHLNQEEIDNRSLTFEAILSAGRRLFSARFNRLDGQGRPGTTGTGNPRELGQPSFIRTSAPDSNSCAGCHHQPRIGGAGDFVANVFVLAQALDPVTFSIDASNSNERNTLGMMGAGPIEMLAREMSEDLIRVREDARMEAREKGMAVTRNLIAKGVHFGTITLLPDGKIVPTDIRGVDWDLIIKPFHQKGAVVSLREFTNNAMNHHHGMQSVERFGLETDPDKDGVTNELTIGDISATTLFQAALDTPISVIPEDSQRREAVVSGEQLFTSIGCAICHIPQMELNDRHFTEPNPFNPPGNLHPDEVPQPYSFDMTAAGFGQRLQKSESGGAIIRSFTDLKRHNLCDDEFNHFCNEQVPQGMINGFAPEEDFTILPHARSTEEFLTRKLWDAGNSDPYGHRGDITTLTDAIHYHGGEGRASRDAFFDLPKDGQDSIIEFLKSMQVAETISENIEPKADHFLLKKGWNLISFTGQPTAQSIREVFSGITISSHLWTWENDHFITVESIEVNKGYWLYYPGPQESLDVVVQLAN